MWCPRPFRVLVMILFSPGAWALSPMVADVDVNAVSDGVVVFMADEAQRLFASEETLRRWRVNAPLPPAEIADGRRWYPLHALTGLETHLDPRTMRLSVEIDPALLPTTRVGGQPEPPLPQPPDPGGFLDYQAGLARSPGQDADLWSLGLSPTLFGPFGRVSTQMLWRSSTGEAVPGEGWLRLDSTWTRDDPGTMRSFRAGDAVTGGASWQRGVRFGGLQLATNFATRPRFSAVPQPPVRGTAVLPTRVDVLLNGQPAGSAEIPPGQWALDRLPVTTGTGELTVVTTDLAGRRQEFALDFYASPRQLRAGLSDFSLSAGWTRQDYGLESFRYGTPFVATSLRRGHTDRLTVETGAEASEDFANLGLGASYSLPGIGLFSVASAASRESGGSAGALWQLGFERRDRRINFSAALQGSTPGFRYLGDDLIPALKRQALATIGVSLGRLGTVAWTSAYQAPYEFSERTFTQAGYTRTFASGLSLSAFWRHHHGDGGESTVGMAFNWRMGKRSGAGATVAATDDRWESTVEYRRDLPLSDGVGYRVRTSAGGGGQTDAVINANAGPLRLDADARRTSGGTDWSVFASGAVVWLDSLHASRQVRDSFAVVDTGGLPGVRVYWENQEVGRSDADGRLLVTSMRPFDANKLSVEIADLPLDTRASRPVARVVPFGGAGVAVDFGIRRLQGVTLRALRPSGSPLPAGAVAHHPRGLGAWPVGYDGRLYLPDVSDLREVHLRWRGEECTLPLPARPDSTAPVVHLGDLTCGESR